MQQHDERMRHAFADQAKALHGLSDQRIPNGDAIVIGCETEFSVVDCERLTPVSEQQRDAIVGAMPDSADVELGAFQLELKTKPISVTQHGLKAVVEAQAKVELAATAAAVSQGAALLRAGAYPLPMDIMQIPRTSKEKYRQVPDFHDAHRQRFVDTTLGRDGILNVNSAAVIALANSFQVNLQAADGDDAIRVANTWLSFVPEAAAITGNARFLAGVDTGLSDVRMAAWERSHDTRSVIDFLANRPTRIGLPEDYYGGLDDYFERVASFPFILHHEAAALQVGIGLYWNDVRIKFLGGHIVVEFRPISTQPTMEEDVAVLALLLGWLKGPGARRPLRPMALLQRDRQQAMNFGLEAKLHAYRDGEWVLVPARELLQEVLDVCGEGLDNAGLDPDPFLPLLRQRLIDGTPSDRFAREIHRLTSAGAPLEQAIRTVFAVHIHGMR